MVDGGVNRWCILATSKTHPRMSPRGSEFREPQGYLPGPLPANKWSRRIANLGAHLFAYNYPRAYPLTSRAAAAAAVMLNQLKVTAMSYRHPRTTPVATAVQIRRAEEGSPGGFTVGGGAGTIEWVWGGGESETPHSGVLRAGVGGGRGGRDPPPRVLYKIPLMAHLHGKRFKFPPMMLKHLPLTSINP